jgi:hypothetical protein
MITLNTLCTPVDSGCGPDWRPEGVEDVQVFPIGEWNAFDEGDREGAIMTSHP